VVAAAAVRAFVREHEMTLAGVVTLPEIVGQHDARAHHAEQGRQTLAGLGLPQPIAQRAQAAEVALEAVLQTPQTQRHRQRAEQPERGEPWRRIEGHRRHRHRGDSRDRHRRRHHDDRHLRDRGRQQHREQGRRHQPPRGIGHPGAEARAQPSGQQERERDRDAQRQCRAAEFVQQISAAHRRPPGCRPGGAVRPRLPR
jgi:hypothetical protein